MGENDGVWFLPNWDRQSKPDCTGGRGCGRETVGQEGWRGGSGNVALSEQLHKDEAADWTLYVMYAWLTQVKALNLKKLELLEDPNDWGCRSTGGKNSVIADIETPPAGTEWPPGTIAAVPVCSHRLLRDPGIPFHSLGCSFVRYANILSWSRCPGAFAEWTGIGEWLAARQTVCRK